MHDKLTRVQRFRLPDNAPVVTTHHVTRERLPILLVIHQYDREDACDVWQFHSGDGDYSAEVLQLVALHEVVELDPIVAEVADMPVGYLARRAARSEPWMDAVDDPTT